MSETRNTKPVSRRKALKTLAALSGVVTLSNLPPSWRTPIIEVGTLPVHAQASPPTVDKNLTISNLSLSGAQGVCDAGGGKAGDVFKATFNYQDRTGGRVQVGVATVRAEYRFPDGRTDRTEVTLEAINISGGGVNGTVVVPLCVGFGKSNTVEVTLTLKNNIGTRSNRQNGNLTDPTP